MFVVQAHCTGMGWVDTKHQAPTEAEAKQKEHALLRDNNAWMPGDYTRQTRLVYKGDKHGA